MTDYTSELDQKIVEHDQKFDEQGNRITAMAEDLDGYAKDLTKVSSDVASVSKVVDELATRVTKLETASTGGTGNPLQWCIDLATIGGLNDEDRKNEGCKQSKATGKPMVLPDGRPFEPATPFTMWGAGGAEPAFRLLGVSPTGTQNLEQGTTKVRSWIKPGAGVRMDEQSLFVNPGTIFDYYLADFAVQGGGGQGNYKQFWFGPYSKGRNAYRGSFRNIAMNFMASGFGTDAQPAAFTAAGWHGQFEYLNCWPGYGGFLNIGGSDCFGSFHLNAGPSASTLQTGRIVNGVRADWLINLNSLSKSKFFCNAFCTANNGWGALRIRGSKSSTYDLHFHGAVLEGYKPTGTQPSGPAHGTLVRLEGGVGSLGELGIGQGMAWPAAGERSVLEVLDGDWALQNITFYKGDGAPAPASAYIPYYDPKAKVQTFGFTYRDL